VGDRIESMTLAAPDAFAVFLKEELVRRGETRQRVGRPRGLTARTGAGSPAVRIGFGDSMSLL
jgi:hypothetical protein